MYNMVGHRNINHTRRTILNRKKASYERKIIIHFKAIVVYYLL